MNGKKRISNLLQVGLDSYQVSISIFLVLLIISFSLYQAAKNQMILIDPITVLVDSLIFSSIIFIILIIYSYSRVKAASLAKELTVEVTSKNARLEALFDSISQPLIVLTKKGKILDSNTIAQNWFAEEMLKKNQSFISRLNLEKTDESKLPKNVTQKNIITKVISDKKRYRLNHFKLFSKKGVKYVDLVLSPILEKEKIVGLLCLLENVTDEHILQESKDEFVSIVSHQLNTPITSLNWHLELLNEAESKKEQEDATQALTSIGHSLKELTSSLLNIGRIESGRVSLDVAEIDLEHLLKEIEETLGDESKTNKLSIYIDEHLEKTRLKSDPDLLKHILINLLTNAFKYSDQKPVTLHFEKQKDFVLISVQDDGRGIPKKEQSQIFEKFFRASNAVKDKPGTGLGMYLVKIIVDQLEGDIWFVSTQKGTTFFVLLPLEGVVPKKGSTKLN